MKQSFMFHLHSCVSDAKKQIQKKKEWHWENVFNTQNKSVNVLCEKIIVFPH